MRGKCHVMHITHYSGLSFPGVFKDQNVPDDRSVLVILSMIVKDARAMIN